MSYHPHPLPELPSGSVFASAEYRDIMKGLMRAGDGERPTDWRKTPAWDMSQVHIGLLTLLERTYRFADWAVEKDDLANYLGFAEVSVFQIYKHHDAEEEFFFPEMCAAGKNDIWQRNIEEHHTFSPAIDTTWLFIRHQRTKLSVSPTPVPPPSEEISKLDTSSFKLDFDTAFDPLALRQHIDGYLLPLAQHLLDEIATLAPEYLELVGKPEYDKLMDHAQKHLMAYDPAWFLCSMFATLDIKTCLKLIPIPWVVRRVLVPWWWGPKYIAYWRYASHPENLTFAGSAG